MPTPPTDPAPTPPPIQWQIEVPLVTNRFIMSDTFKTFGLGTLLGIAIFGGILGVRGGIGALRTGALVMGAIGASFYLMALLIYAVLFGNHWPLEFEVNDRGVITRNNSGKARAIHRTAFVVGVMTGKPQGAAAGMIAQSRETVGLRWEDVRSVRYYPPDHVIEIKGGFLANTRLHCTPANYADVAATVAAQVRAHAPGAVTA